MYQILARWLIVFQFGLFDPEILDEPSESNGNAKKRPTSATKQRSTDATRSRPKSSGMQNVNFWEVLHTQIKGENAQNEGFCHTFWSQTKNLLRR